MNGEGGRREEENGKEEEGNEKVEVKKKIENLNGGDGVRKDEGGG